MIRNADCCSGAHQNSHECEQNDATGGGVEQCECIRFYGDLDERAQGSKETRGHNKHEPNV